jgi:hypothetical protein
MRNYGRRCASCDLIVQETGHRMLKARGIDIIAANSPTAFVGEPQLGSCHGPVELRHGAEDLADQRRRRRVLDEATMLVNVETVTKIKDRRRRGIDRHLLRRERTSVACKRERSGYSQESEGGMVARFFRATRARDAHSACDVTM